MSTASKTDLIDGAKERVDEAKEKVDRAVKKASPFIEGMARVGFAAKGLAYFLVGGLAGMAAVGAGAKMLSRGGLIQWLAGKPLGWVMAIGLGIGFGAYGLWQIFWAARDPEFEGTSWKGIGKRIGKFFSGIVHLGLVWLAFRIAWGQEVRDESGDARAQDWTAWGMSYPLGRWIVAGVGIGFVAYAFSQALKAWRLDADEELHPREISKKARDFACWVGRFGIAARAVVFFIIGCFLVMAAWFENANQARGLGGALHALAERPYGWILLLIVALGLIAYGGYALVQAKYKRLRAR